MSRPTETADTVAAPGKRGQVSVRFGTPHERNCRDSYPTCAYRESNPRPKGNDSKQTEVKKCLSHQDSCLKMGLWQPNLRPFKTQSSTFPTPITVFRTSWRIG